MIRLWLLSMSISIIYTYLLLIGKLYIFVGFCLERILLVDDGSMRLFTSWYLY